MPKNSYRITTNGILFDKYREFFLKYNFKVAFSYDGNNALRSKDILDHPIEYPFVNISCTLFHGNTNLEYIMHQFNEKEKVISVSLSLYPQALLPDYTFQKIHLWCQEMYRYQKCLRSMYP